MANIEELKARRKELRITFEDLSIKSGIPLRTLENIFHGVTKHPRIDTMQAIERALGIGEIEQTQELSSEEKEFASLVSQLTEEDRKELARFADYLICKRNKNLPTIQQSTNITLENKETSRMTIPEIKHYMKERKITYEELSLRSGLSLSTIKKIFSGISQYPRINTLQAIKLALGIEEIE